MLLKNLYWQLVKDPKEFGTTTINSGRDILEQAKVLVLFYSCLLVPNLSRRLLGIKDQQYVFGQKKSLLVISYYSAPYRSLHGTQRLGKFIKYLTRLGWDITLVSTQPADVREQDLSDESIADTVRVFRTSKYQVRGLTGKRFIVPDDFICWILPAVRAVHEALEQQPASLILATAPPYSNLLVGAICSRLFGIPLVCDFRDPWTKIDVAKWMIDRPILRKLNESLEGHVLKVSSTVIMADEKKYMQEYFPILDGDIAKKVVSISNGFDEEDFVECQTPERDLKPRSEFKIAYVGVIYDQESFDNIVRPFQLWRQKWPEQFPTITFEYAGSSSRYFRNVTDLPFSYLDHGYVSHRDAIAIRANCDVQLFAQPSHFKQHVLSGKIFEMIRVGVPIVAVTHPSGAVAELIEKTATGVVLRQNSFEENARILKELYEKWRRGEVLTQINRNAVMEFSRKNLAGQLARTFEAELGLCGDVG